MTLIIERGKLPANYFERPRNEFGVRTIKPAWWVTGAAWQKYTNGIPNFSAQHGFTTPHYAPYAKPEQWAQVWYDHIDRTTPTEMPGLVILVPAFPGDEHQGKTVKAFVAPIPTYFEARDGNLRVLDPVVLEQLRVSLAEFIRRWDGEPHLIAVEAVAWTRYGIRLPDLAEVISEALEGFEGRIELWDRGPVRMD